MKRQQLYIKDVAVDMPSEEIKIKVESNLFSDAGKIMTAHSYSISLPRTMTNDAVLGNAYLPIADTAGKSTHKYLKASLYMDGVPLFQDGQAVINKVDDKGYNINLYWGLLGLFDLIKDEGLDICDLMTSKMHSSQEDTTMWLNMLYNGTPIDLHRYVSGMTNDIYNTLDDDSKALANKLPWGLPIYSANEILTFINLTYGLVLDISATAQERIDKLYHAPTTLKCLAKDEKCVVNMHTAWEKQGSNPYYLCFISGASMNDFYDYPYLSPLQYDSPSSVYNTASNKYQANNAIIAPSGSTDQLYANCKIAVEKVRVFGYDTQKFYFEINGETFESSYSDGAWRMDKTISDEFSIDKGNFVLRVYSNASSPTALASNINVQLWLKDIDITEGCYTTGGNWWSDVRNFPQMSVIEYLNELLAHIGGCIVGSVTKPASLRITTFDEVASAYAVNADSYGVKTIEMAFGDQAQKNIYTHKENDDNGVKYKGEGIIYTKDTTLEISRTAFESKMKVPMNTMVRLWKVEKDPDSSKYKASWAGGIDYILGYDSVADIGRNTGQDFASTIEAYYIYYKQLVEHPKVIEVMVRLSVFDLIDFDFEKPLHINQLNRSYLVKSLESDKGEQYKLTLVQM
ncbi:MAG: hypothetical protein IK100_09505 [Muribaculaceae bacterium]|nr:hypothetical protein [Muribaculaceae bacterium]